MDTGKVYFHRNLSSHMEKQADWDGVLDDKKIISALKLHKKEQFMQLMEKAASHCQKGGMNIERNVAKLYHDLLQTFYSCLRDNNIQAHALFRDPKMQELSAYSERSIPDMLQFAAYLFDRSAEMLTMVDGYSDVVGTVKQYIAEHYKEDIDRNDIAAVAYITPNYLSKRFHMEVGMSLREYINQLRIEEAKRLLLTTNSSVSDIAGEVGFDNISYFSTVFRKLCGMSPMDWRNHT